MIARWQSWNLVGVVLLVVLCGLQWAAQRRVELDRRRLDQGRIEHEARLAEQSRQLEAQKFDLEYFRRHVQETAHAARTNEVRLEALERDLDLLRAERDDARASLTQWEVAVRERDAHLVRAAVQVRELVAEREGLAGRVNELAGRQNRLVEELNARTREYNQLVTQVNETARSEIR